MTRLNQETSEVLREVESGEVLVVTSHGRPVATLSPFRSTYRVVDNPVRLAAIPSADPQYLADLARIRADWAEDFGDDQR